MTAHVLVVEDDPTSRLTLAQLLERAGYTVLQASTGETAIDMLEQHVFAVVVSDIVLGAIDGIEVLHTARLQPQSPNVILLTGHGTLETAIAAVRSGAHDYMLKPASKDELMRSVARAVQDYRDRHHLREAAAIITGIYQRQQPPEAAPGAEAEQRASAVYQVGDLTIGATRHDVTASGEPVQLTPIEYALLRFLAEAPGQTRSYCDIVRRTHRFEAEEAEAQALVRQHIRNLRKKLDGRYLVNDRGSGYKLVDPGSEAAEA
jgi:DNA-binding response OmpR family regulator